MTPTAKAGRREWLGLAVLVLPCLLVSMDMSVLFFGLPFISAELAPTSSQLLWIVDIYGFLLGGLLITMGSLGDRIGRRRLLLIGATAFGAASVAAAFSSSAELLIAARAVLGVAGATLAPSTLSLIRNMFHDSAQRTLAISVWTSGFAGGAVLGPIVGGMLLEHFWWGSVFLINVPAMALLLVLGPLLLPEFRNPDPDRFDLISAVLSLAAVLPIINGVKRIAEDVAIGWPAVLSIVAGLTMGALFVRRQRRRPDPMIDVKLFRKRSFSVSITVGVLSTFAMLGFALLSSQYMQLVLGLGPLEAALWNLPTFLAMMVSTTLGALLSRVVRPGYVVGAGLALTATGFVMLSRLETGTGIGYLVVSVSVMLFGMGAGMALATDLVMASAPPGRAGAASAMAETGGEFGGALGMAIFGSIGIAVYRADIAGTAPAGLPPEALDAAGETLGGAVAVAGRVPPELGAPLLASAREAFTSGIGVTAVAGAVILATASVLAVVMLRGIRSSDVAEATRAAETPEQAGATADEGKRGTPVG
ncbi:MFS transporter [Amycolatopsis antarctica]|uniref:MFS transporter n=1 Tax=Amycolatopsis antarctica TaxID=1854586 RepID=A0A263D714_9PSEU|nr:MFS transporter [Amycolatopsis antarctica]OZM73205.1 MFS transporter [Amycolatopsis antarctica]